MTQKASTKETIGIIAWGAMADVLYATPIVRQIRRANPEAHITWLIRDKFAEVVETNPDINAVKTFTLPTGYDSRQDAELKMDCQILIEAHDNFDRVFDLQYWPRHSNFFERPSEDFISLRARNAGLAAPTDRKIVLECTPGDLQATADFVKANGIAKVTDKFITVNHISYAASPVWPPGNYESLVTELASRGIKSVFTGAPNEPIPDGAIDARGMPYRVWANLISISDLWLGLDSGAVALACASNTPIIKLHSPDFPLNKTGIRAMGLRNDSKVLELCPAPGVSTMADFIEGYTCETSTN